jgi:UDP-N-acetylglucosamine acyltransferase
MNQPLSYIHPQAEIADNVVIEPFVTISKDVVVGEGTWIGPNVTIMEGARIGKNCKIFPGAVISAIPQDFKYKGEKTTVEIGDNTIIREFVTINRGTTQNMSTKIGKNCMLMAYVHIAHDCIIGDNCILANNSNLAGHIELGDYVILGGAVNISQFLKIGAHAFISGGCLLNKDIPPYIKAARHPTVYAGINSVGLRRRGFSNERINQISEIYRLLFIKGYNTTNALKIIETQVAPSEDRDDIINFVKDSVRGILKGFNSKNENE